MDYEQIRSEVVSNGGIKCVRMQILRDASPYRKLGPGVNQEISNALHQKSLDHSELRYYQHEKVYVWESGSAAGQLMNSIMGEPSDDGAVAILKAVGGQNGDTEKARLEELKALIVQMNDVFATEGEEGSD